ncbi:MAG: M23 family metallopeptidase [Candidatus Magasanikbacteria bacterium]|nr:M23 family metallopeptidase [Candidatus Magasanikbacteria bacterium]
MIARDIIQPVFFGLLFLITIPQTKFFVQKSIFLPGQKTIAFNLVGDNSDYSFEEVAADSQSGFVNSNYAWRSGVITAEDNLATDEVVYNQDLVGTFAGGMAINKPWLMSGAVSKSGSVERKEAAKYIVAPGDTLKSVAIKFGVNVDTILWENNLTAKATLKLGQVLSIPPASGVMYTVKKGDTLGRIAGVYGAKSADIIAFNNLTSDGHDLHVGERIMIPGGTKQEIRSPVTLGSKIASNNVAPKNSKYIIQQEINGSVIAPPSSRQSPGAAGFVWPAAVHTITQYFGWTHHALDIAGPFETPTYAAKAGVVEKSQCGWNSGYGCVVIIDHGNGIKTLYGHHAKLLVSVGDHVETGQTIGLMGNTGNVRGITGIHVHFEVIVNGARVNPLGYVR